VDKKAGFPSHQHRGFEAITYMLEGSFKHKDDLVKDGIAATTIVGDNSPIKLNTDVLYQHIEIKRDKKFHIKLPKRFKGFLYVIDGKLNELIKGEALFLEQDILVTSKLDSMFVIIAGKPHNEPIYQHGPFVD